jgi:hypothetical protein
MSMMRTRWAAIGAAVAVSLGAGGIGLVYATTNPSDARSFVSITPCRLVDTRAGADNVGPRSTPLDAGATMTFSATGSNGECTGIPTDATGLSLNVTAVGATRPTYLTVWQASADQPKASSLNPAPGEGPTSNAVTTLLSGSGQFSVFNLDGAVDVIIDVNGYYVDHDHEIDGNGQIVLNPADFVRSGYTVEAEGGLQWLRDPFLTKIGSASVQCVDAPFDIPPGRAVSSVILTYTTPSGAEIGGTLEAMRVAPGPSTGALVRTSIGSIVLPASTGGAFSLGTLEVDTPVPAEDGFQYALTMCTADAISIAAVALQV